jgi:redox-sensitive bicupin YhaK (pirin superfamily)
MSGPVATVDAPPKPEPCHPEHAVLEITQAREATVGRFQVRRALPRRGRRTVGAWCFVDHMGPAAVTEAAGLDIGPHPHMGLQTVTWLVAGQALHRDSLGSEQVLKPGQLNIMTAGNAVAHSEEATGAYRGDLHGVQLWVAQPDATRHGGPAFEHHAQLPAVELGRVTATVFVGELAGAGSPARHDTPLVGGDLAVQPGGDSVPLKESFEYALVVLEGALMVQGQRVVPGQLCYLGRDRDELTVDAAEPTRALLIGGEPFEEPLVMWWNFVARNREELAAARRDWEAGTRFGRVASPLDRIAAPEPYWPTRGG